jgi:hypothetical protein
MTDQNQRSAIQKSALAPTETEAAPTFRPLSVGFDGQLRFDFDSTGGQTLPEGLSDEADTTWSEDQLPGDEAPIRVMALHAMLYCERLYFLEEVEEIRVADANVYAGRRLHDDVVGLDDETPEKRSLSIESEVWGLTGKVDALRRRDGVWVAYEHKRGRSRRNDEN